MEGLIIVYAILALCGIVVFPWSVNSTKRNRRR